MGGAGDQAAGAIGMGIVSPGKVSATIGTSGVVFAATARPALDPRGRLHTFCHALPGRWFVMGVTQAAGGFLFAGSGISSHVEPTVKVSPTKRLTAEAANAPAGCDGLSLGSLSYGGAHSLPRPGRAREF